VERHIADNAASAFFLKTNTN